MLLSTISNRLRVPVFKNVCNHAKRYFSTNPWESPMDDKQFSIMRDILYSPSPINFESSMTKLIANNTKEFAPEGWKFHGFKSNAGLVVDSDPLDNKKLSCMVIGHADKIRLQVKSVASDGKIYIESDSHLPVSLLGNEVIIFVQDENGQYRKIEGATIEAVGAIHFADPKVRTGAQGLKPEDLYLELQLHGEDRKKQVTEQLKVKQGDPILMQRQIKRGVGINSFVGSHLDNGLGCYVTQELSRMVALNPIPDLRFLFTYCTHEEIGRFGSRQLASIFKPDILIAVDVNHDYNAAPGIGSKHYPDIKMGGGPTIGKGAICSPFLNSVMEKVAKDVGIPLQLDVNGRDTGTDAMAGVLGNIDAASATVGIPVRNMHTISECAVTTDVTATIHLLYESLKEVSRIGLNSSTELFAHPDLSTATSIKLEEQPKQ